jgi:glutathione S-transferase
MKLYGGKLSPYVMRVVMAARHKGVALEIEMPAEGIKSPAYLALNPIGKMPTLVDGDFVLPESEVIAQYIDEASDGPSLLPGDAQARARARLISRLVDVYLSPNLSALFGAKDPDAAKAGIEAMGKCLDYIEHFRGKDYAFAAGDAFSLADCTLVPMLFFLDAFDGQHGTSKLISRLPGLGAWWGRYKASPAGSAIIAEMGAALQAFMSQSAAKS